MQFSIGGHSEPDMEHIMKTIVTRASLFDGLVGFAVNLSNHLPLFTFKIKDLIDRASRGQAIRKVKIIDPTSLRTVAVVDLRNVGSRELLQPTLQPFRVYFLIR
jgi:hypothetical protein